jgi:hypothetical protein
MSFGAFARSANVPKRPKTMLSGSYLIRTSVFCDFCISALKYQMDETAKAEQANYTIQYGWAEYSNPQETI